MVVGFLPAAIAVAAFVVVGIRIQSFGLALVGWAVCTLVAFGLSKILVEPPPSSETAELSPTTNTLGD